MISRCTLCPRLPRRRPIPPDGPTPCRLLLLGEAPSFEEDERGLPFVGKTGHELTQTYLPLLALPRSEIHIANARWCSEYNYANPTHAQALSCSSIHLAPLLAEVKPWVIAPMGAVACSLWPEINLNLHHGIPMAGEWGGWQGVLWPMYHPSAGIHDGTSAYMIPLMADFYGLGKFLKSLGG